MAGRQRPQPLQHLAHTGVVLDGHLIPVFLPPSSLQGKDRENRVVHQLFWSSLLHSSQYLRLQSLPVLGHRCLQALPVPVGILLLPISLGCPVDPGRILRPGVAAQRGVGPQIQFLALPAVFFGAPTVVWKPILRRVSDWLRSKLKGLRAVASSPGARNVVGVVRILAGAVTLSRQALWLC